MLGNVGFEEFKFETRGGDIKCIKDGGKDSKEGKDGKEGKEGKEGKDDISGSPRLGGPVQGLLL